MKTVGALGLLCLSVPAGCAGAPANDPGVVAPSSPAVAAPAQDSSGQPPPTVSAGHATSTEPTVPEAATPTAPVVDSRPPLSCSGEPARCAAMASNALATDLYGELASSTENLVFSPASISVALAMTYAGPRGATAAELQTSLHFDLVPEGQLDATYQGLLAGLEKHRPGVELVVANRLFCEKSAAFERPFLDRVARVFRAPIGTVDFKNEPDRSTDEINRWVGQCTRAKIQDVIPKGTLTSDARLVVTNAVYFKGRWAEEFKRSDTSDAPFHTADGRTVTVGMMHQTKSFGAGYSAADHLKVVELPYRGGDLSMVVLLCRTRSMGLETWRGRSGRIGLMGGSGPCAGRKSFWPCRGFALPRTTPWT